MLTLLCLFKIATLTHHFPSSSGEGHRHLNAKEIKKFSHIFQNIALMTHVIKFTLNVVCREIGSSLKSSSPVNKNQARPDGEFKWPRGSQQIPLLEGEGMGLRVGQARVPPGCRGKRQWEHCKAAICPPSWRRVLASLEFTTPHLADVLGA